MGSKLRCLDESFAAVLARVWLDTSMSAQVAIKCLLGCKPCKTLKNTINDALRKSTFCFSSNAQFNKD